MKKIIIGILTSLCIVSTGLCSAIKIPVVTEVNTSTYTEIINTSDYCNNFAVWLEDGLQFRYSTDGTDEHSALSPENSIGLSFPTSSVKGASVLFIKSITSTVNCVFQPGD